MNHRLSLSTILLFTVLLTPACGTRLSQDERAELRATREKMKLQKEISRIQPIGKNGNRHLSKEEAHYACTQKAKVAVNEAIQVEEIRQSIEYKNKSGGGLSGGIALALSKKMDMDNAKDRARNSAMNSCLIDYGYIRK